MKKTLLFIWVLLIGFNLLSQNYPYPIYKGAQEKIISYTDTLWVLKANQFNKALLDSKELLNIKQQLRIYNFKIILLNQQKQEKDSLLGLLKKDRDYYLNTWKETENDLSGLTKQLKKETRKKKFYKTTSIIGIPVFFILGLLLI